MRLLLCVDMEGISQITNYRQLWAPFPEYWDSGRDATTADTIAAIHGLRAGGAKSVVVCEMHGPVLGPIVDQDALPSPATWVDKDEVLQYSTIGREFDALFLLGWHARCGTRDGFMSHTGGINLRVAVDGKPITEAHITAWRTGLPLLGITGDAALEPQLDGAIEGVPFLAVKKAESRPEAEPLHSPDDSAAAIKAFAEWCVKHGHERVPTPIPERFVLSMSMAPRVADYVEGQHELQRTSPAIVARSITDWWYEADPAIRAAVNASFSALDTAGDDTEALQRVLTEWAHADEREWLT
ncbi:hypothetical protein BH23CHL2_BH23CHL2_05160 [soil metagenome]